MAEREFGRIKNWFESKGYGFIRCDDDGSDVFAHVSQTAFLIPKVGARVSFVRGTNSRTDKPEAKAVAILEGDTQQI